MLSHARLAEQAGVPSDRCVVVEDGTPVVLRRRGPEIVVETDEAVPVGLVYIDGKSRGDVGDLVLRDRRILARGGIVVCTVVLSPSGDLVAGPTLVSRGVVYMDESKLTLEHAALEVRRALAECGPDYPSDQRAEAVRQVLRRFFRRELDRRPLVVPVLLTRDES